MLLLNLRPSKAKTNHYHVEVQNGDKAYRSEPVRDYHVKLFVKDVVMAMLSTGFARKPFLDKAIPAPKELSKPLKNGIGLAESRNEIVLVTKGEVEVLYKHSRWRVAEEFIRIIDSAVMDGRYLSNQWKKL